MYEAKYIGMEVHTESISIAVRNDVAKIGVGRRLPIKDNLAQRLVLPIYKASWSAAPNCLRRFDLRKSTTPEIALSDYWCRAILDVVVAMEFIRMWRHPNGIGLRDSCPTL